MGDDAESTVESDQATLCKARYHLDAAKPVARDRAFSAGTERSRLENLSLRQQLAVLGRRAKRSKLTGIDRAFWVALSRLWPRWKGALMLVKPATVIGWHRKGFA